MATIRGTSRADIIDASARTDNLTIYGQGGSDTITGGRGSDKIYAGGGNDRIYASPFDAVIDGGAGADTVDFSNYVADATGYGVDVRLFGGHIGLWPNEEGAVVPEFPSGSIKNVENVVGSNYDDAILGNSAVNRLSGGAGDDWMMAYGSGDFLTGGTGADMFAFDNAGTKTTVTDFSYAAGDRLFFTYMPNINWVQGSAPDAGGVTRAAWIGTYLDSGGNSEQVIVLGTAQPTNDWIISLA